MAIKLSKEGKVLKVSPHFRKYFDISTMEEAVNGWPEPIKIGPIWVIRNESALKSPDNLNDLASRFFHTPIYGDILVLSSHELPKDWDLMEDSDKLYTADEIDAGFVKSLSEMNMFENFHTLPDELDFTNRLNLFEPQRIEYTYTPEKQVKDDDEFKDFLRNAYDHVISYSPDLKSFIVYEDDTNIVKVKEKKDMLKTIDQMLKIFVEDELYEKAAKLRDLRPIIEEK